MAAKKEVVLDDLTRQELLTFGNMIADLESKRQLICVTYLRARGIKGNANLNGDCSKLILEEKENG